MRIFVLALCVVMGFAGVTLAFYLNAGDSSSRAASDFTATLGSRRVIILEFERPVEGFMVVNTTVRRSLPPRAPGARRYVEVPVFFVYKVSGDRAVLTVPDNVDRISISGPFSRNLRLTPLTLLVEGDTLTTSANLTIKWPAIEGFAVTLSVLPLLDGGYPEISVEVQTLESEESIRTLRWLTPDYQMWLGRSVPELFFCASRFILPPLGQVEVLVKVRLKSRVETLKWHLNAERNGSLVVEDIAALVLQTNREELNRLLEKVSDSLGFLESKGFYLGSSRRLLSVAESVVTEGGGLLEVFGQRLAYSLLSNLDAYLTRLKEGPSVTYILVLTAAEMLLCLLVGWRLSERLALKVSSTLAMFAGIWALTLQLLPRLRVDMVTLASAFAVLGAFVALRAALKLKPLQAVSTASGATLEGLISSTVNFSVSFLARRKLRAALLLITTASMAFGATCLTAFTMHTAISHQYSGVLSTVDTPCLVARGYGLTALGGITPVNVAGLAFLAGRDEVQSVSPSAIAVFPMSPYDTVGGLPISGLYGLTQDSPLATLLERCCIVEGSVSRIYRGAIIISDTLAKVAGKGVGDSIEIRGFDYTVIAIFDSKALAKAKDIDGDDLLPTIMVGTSSYKPPAEGVVFLHYEDALLAGAVVNKVYVKLAPGADTTTLARVLSLLGNVNVFVAEVGKPVEVYYPGFRVEVIGVELLVPSLVALLIVYTSFLGFVYEVRKDIFTLSTLGATPDQVFLLFVTMASIIGFAGGVTGYMAGLVAFRSFNALKVQIPVDVKLDTASLLFSVATPTALALLGALSPASRAVLAAVPSLRRRWMVEAEESEKDEVEREVTFVSPIPVIIKSEEKAKEFAKFLESKLVEMAGNKVSVYEVSRWVEGSEGSPTFVIYFEYLQVEGRAFKSYNKVMIKRVDGRYVVELESKIVTIYTMFAKECLRDVASLVRKLTLEWKTEES